MAKSRKLTADELRDAYEKAKERDEGLRRKVRQCWGGIWKRSLLIAIVILVVMLLERTDRGLWVVSQLWGIPIEFLATGLGIARGVGRYVVLSNGRKLRGNIFQQLIHYISTFAPLYLCLVLRLNINPITAIFAVPAAILGVLVYSFVMTTPNSAMSQGSSITPLDMVYIQQNQKLANVDPNKVPTMVLDRSVKTMTPMDWHWLKVDMSLAGYDISLKKEK